MIISMLSRCLYSYFTSSISWIRSRDAELILLVDDDMSLNDYESLSGKMIKGFME